MKLIQWSSNFAADLRIYPMMENYLFYCTEAADPLINWNCYYFMGIDSDESALPCNYRNSSNHFFVSSYWTNEAAAACLETAAIQARFSCISVFTQLRSSFSAALQM